MKFYCLRLDQLVVFGKLFKFYDEIGPFSDCLETYDFKVVEAIFNTASVFNYGLFEIVLLTKHFRLDSRNFTLKLWYHLVFDL